MARLQSNNVTLDFVIPNEADLQYISIPQSLSLLNRKSYRDGYVYSVDYMEFIGRAEDVLSIGKIPSGYTTHSAWRMGFEAWKEQRHSALEETPGASPGKWADFKCKFDLNDVASSRIDPYGLALNGAMSQLSAIGSEWITSTIFYNDVGAATVSDVEVGLLGPNVIGAYGALVQTWGDTRAGTVAPDPNMPGAASTSWIIRTGEEAGEMAVDVMNEVEGDNDLPPYANVVEDGTAPTPIYVGGELSAPGGVLSDVTTLGTTGRFTNMNGGLFPLGLMKLFPSWTDASLGQSRILRVHLTRGEYKGVAAVRMGDFS